jgi:glucokinase
MKKQPIYLGIDLGGTAFKVALFTETGELVASQTQPTLSERGPEDIMDRMAGLAIAMWEKEGYAKEEVLEAGIGSPGPLDLKAGTVVFTPNLGWKNVRLRDMMAERLGLPVTIDNDAVAATAGEFWVGAGRPYSDVLGITLGTGVGGGLIINGKIYHGAQDIAGHVGHMIIQMGGRQCGCGNRGCLETYASARGIVATATEASQQNPDSLLRSIKPPLTSRKVYEAAIQGDAAALQVFDDTARYLAAGINSAMNLVNPQAVIIMGAVANAGETLLAPLREHLGKMAFSQVFEGTKILRGTLGDLAGAVGAAGFAKLR